MENNMTTTTDNKFSDIKLQVVAEGDTWENDYLRVQRLRDFLKVTDLTHAGKRGKVCRTVCVGDWQDEDLARRLDGLSTTALRVARQNGAEAFADFLVALAAEKLDGAITTAKGVHTNPPHVLPVIVEGPAVRIRAEYDTFSVQCLKDKYNEPTAIPATYGKVKDIRAFYALMVSDEGEAMRVNTFQEVLDIMSAKGLDYHRFCAVD
jgi:hypothetical protein